MSLYMKELSHEALNYLASKPSLSMVILRDAAGWSNLILEALASINAAAQHGSGILQGLLQKLNSATLFAYYLSFGRLFCLYFLFFVSWNSILMLSPQHLPPILSGYILSMAITD